MATTVSTLAVGDKVSLSLKTATQAHTLYDMTVLAVESDSVTVTDSMGPMVIRNTDAGWRAEGASVTVVEVAGN